MIARPKISRNEWNAAERGACGKIARSSRRPSGRSGSGAPVSSRGTRVAKFFLQLNKPALAYAEQRRDALEREGNRLDVVAVSHFLPLPELFPGPLLLKAVMGCAGLQKQIDKVDCVRVAVAGHSHINFDQDIDDVRYVQLGHAERDDTGARKARDLKPALLYSARPLYA
ncbi:calcineurin-like phosphoesterase [Aureococcus anophagefferens]|nr:calcineurin-like phosphoesterase [Aureococcus anophagefferens]